MAKILFLSHGHPKFSKGGAEVASWNLFQEFKSRDFDCLYVARHDNPDKNFSRIANDQVLFHTRITDWFCLSSSDTSFLFDDLGTLVKDFQPDVVHVHHYAHIGIEVFQALKRAVPEAKIVFTIHEFMAMCMHNGQMVKNRSYELCSKATPSDCHDCFPQHSSGDFFLRKSYVLDQFDLVDCFISPSQFLADRYIEWGLPQEKVHVIENILPATISSFPPRSVVEKETRNRFAFFGQINHFKGIELLLDSIQLLADKGFKFELNIHGANLDKQEKEFQKRIQAKLSSVSHLVTMCGSYESSQLGDLMKECDWVVIPSTWWENSPVVIQEAIAYGRPLIGSNIGGMKEKIEGVAGLVFESGNAEALAKTMIEAMKPSCFDKWQAVLPKKANHIKQHIDLIDQLLREYSLK